MRIWARIMAAAVLGVLASGFSQAEDESQDISHSGTRVRWVTAVADAEDKNPAKLGAADGKTAVAPAEPPVGQWRPPAARKPAAGSATKESDEKALSETVKSPAPPKRLAEDPAYRAPRRKPAPDPLDGRTEEGKPAAVGKKSPTESPQPAVPPLTVAPEDQTPCDWCGDCRCRGTCRRGYGDACSACPGEDDPREADQPWRLFDRPALTCRGISIRGWADAGIAVNGDYPLDRFNGPVTFIDRANEANLWQLYLITERQTHTEGRDFDVGGRVDLLYGTDYRFTMANGLEDSWDGGQRFYHVAMPQLYADFALNDWVVRMGRFYSILGYEVVPAVDNFFHSHTYTFQYGEPKTFTGLLAKWQLTDTLAISGGFHRGWDQWEDNNDRLGMLAGVTWNNEESGTSVSFGVTSSDELVGVSSARTVFSIVLAQKLGQRWKYVLQYDGAQETNAVERGGVREPADWSGVINYLFFDINPFWSLGVRYEWFGDNDGARVRGLGAPHGIDFRPDPLFRAYWNDVALGVNWKPHKNVLLRCETRWDWAHAIETSTAQPFDDRTQRSQFLFDTDLIIQF